MGDGLDGHFWRCRRGHEGHVRIHGQITAAHIREAMELIRRLANKPVRDARPIRIQWRIHACWRWPLALGHAR
eukprot:6390388-Pyramimonas_sp.AAC.1